MERFEKVDTLVVDKTGTLTEGKPKVVAVRAFGGVAEDELLRLAASLEHGSEHPLAAAIVRGRDRTEDRARAGSGFRFVDRQGRHRGRSMGGASPSATG